MVKNKNKENTMMDTSSPNKMEMSPEMSSTTNTMTNNNATQINEDVEMNM